MKAQPPMCMQTKCSVLLLDLDGEEDLVCDLVRLLFDVIKCVLLPASTTLRFLNHIPTHLYVTSLQA